MLAKICEGIPDALRQLKGDFMAEFKYDGQRSQIHLLPDGSVKLFSRNCRSFAISRSSTFSAYIPNNRQGKLDKLNLHLPPDWLSVKSLGDCFATCPKVCRGGDRFFPSVVIFCETGEAGPSLQVRTKQLPSQMSWTLSSKPLKVGVSAIVCMKAQSGRLL